MTFESPALRRLYPFESHWLDIDGSRLHYLDEGAGDPVVMVHGNPTWSFYFRHLIHALRPTHRVIAPDHIGCGLSDKPDARTYRYTLERRVRDLRALLDHLDLRRRITFVLHDWGGMIGTACALRRLDAVARVVYLNTAAFLLPPGKRLPWQLALIRNFPPAGKLLVQGLNAFARGAVHRATTRRLPADVRRAYLAPYDSWAHRVATLRFVQDIPLRPGDPSYELARWTDDNLVRLRDKPVFIGWGRRDFVFDDAFLAEWRRRLPQAEVHTFPDAGHYVLEDARDELIPRIVSFVTAATDCPPSAGRESRAHAPDREHGKHTPQVVPVAHARRVCNIATRLQQAAGQLPDVPAIVTLAPHRSGGLLPDRLTFAELDRAAATLAGGLGRIGLRPGMRTIVMIRPGPELFALTFALFRVGAVPVLIDPGMGRRNLVACLARIEAEAFIGIPLAHLLRRLHPAAFRSVRIGVTLGRRWLWGGWRLADLLRGHDRRDDPAPTTAEDVAAILFTSGSTGPAKGVVYTHGIFDAQVRYLREQFHFQPGDIDLATFPLFALFDAALGSTAVIPDMDASRPGSADPRRIIDAIEQMRCTRMFGSPALLERVSRWGRAHAVTLPSLRRIITAGAPVQPRLLEDVSGLLTGDAEIFTPYGATESLPVASIGSREILDQTAEITARGGGTCVGRPLPGMRVRIIAIRDDPIASWDDTREMPAGEIGEIVVSGPVVTHAYFRQPAATEAAKIRDGATIWHRMGDVGYFDEHGRLWFCGRKAHRVETVAGPLYTVCCEAVFNRHPHVRRTALVGVGPRGHQRPVICVELERGRRGKRRPEWKQIVGQLRDLGRAHAHTRAIDTFLLHPGLPVDVRHNAKIFREKLALWAAEQLR